MRYRAGSRAGLTWVEVLVVITIMVILIGLFLPALQRTRDVGGNRVSCMNNLRQLGIGLHNYHTAYNRFPVEDYNPVAKRVQVNPRWHEFSLYVSLLPFIEQDYQLSGEKGEWMLSIKDNTTAPRTGNEARPILVLVCPSRRDGYAAPRDDYAAATQWSMRVTDPVTKNVAWANSILGAASMCATDAGQELFTGATLDAVGRRGDGTATTILLSHKALPATPTRPGVWQYDAYWGDLSQPLPYDHNRDLWDTARSRMPTPETLLGPWQDTPGSASAMLSFGSPHPGSMPTLFADGSVRQFSYTQTGTAAGGVRVTTPAIWQALWGYNDGVAATGDD